MAKPEKTAAPLKGRAARKARKAARAGQPKRSEQILEAFALTRGRDKRFVPYLLLAFVGTLVVFELVGALLNSNYIVTTIFGVMAAALGRVHRVRPTRAALRPRRDRRPTRRSSRDRRPTCVATGA